MMIVFHVLENVGMNIGLLPVTDSLPFVSQEDRFVGKYDGSKLLMSMRFIIVLIFSQEKEEFHSGVK